MVIKFLRKNIGIIITAFGFLLLCILTFGDLGEFMTEQYWENVRDNIMAISYMTVALTLIQTVMKQGMGEQALQRGLNTKNTEEKYNEHRAVVRECTDRIVYMPYFLQLYNDRHTEIRKREFLINNNFRSEKSLFASGRKGLIRKYNSIHTHITVGSIKWATTEISYDKNGRIVPLSAYKRNQLIQNVVSSLLLMVATAFLTKGLFFEASTDVPLWQKFVKLLTYVITISIGSVLTIIKNYEKGAFSVPNELEEINEIWTEFKSWNIPQNIIQEVEEQNSFYKETLNEQRKEADDGRDVVQTEQKEGKDIQNVVSGDVLSFPRAGNPVFHHDDKEFDRKRNGNSASA